MSNILVNKTITGISIAENKEAIMFLTIEENIIAYAHGECCSTTWIESIELPALGFPALVLSTQDLDMSDIGEPELAHYGLKIITDKGEIVIDYRNESNGFYGGELAWPGDYYHNDEKNILIENWQQVK